MTLSELINSPNSVGLVMPYDERLETYIKGKDYIKIARILRNELAIVYVEKNRIEQVIDDFGRVRVNILPSVGTLLARSQMEASRNNTSSRTAVFIFKRKRGIGSDL